MSKPGANIPMWIVAAPDWLDPKWGGPNVTVMPASLGEQLKRERQQAEHERDCAIENLAHREKYWAQFDHVPKGADEPTADPVVTCPACQLGFRISESVPPSKGRFK